MAAPATQGKLCTKLSEMEIGDYIQWHYKADSANVAGVFTDISSGGGYEGLNLAELPTTPGSTANGSFYFLKVDKGLLVADRMVQTDISAQALNAKNYLQGHMQRRSVFRCLSQAEWTKYLTNGDCNGCITKQDNRVWHSVNTNTISYSFDVSNQDERNITITQYAETLQDIKNTTVKNTLFLSGKKYDANNLICYYTHAGTHPIAKGSQYLPIYINASSANIKYTSVSYNGWKNYYNHYISFRPAMEYVENPNSKNIWY